MPAPVFLVERVEKTVENSGSLRGQRMEFYADTDRMIRLLRILPSVVPGNYPLAIDVWTGFMGTGEMNVEMDTCSDWRFYRGIEEDAAAADIEAASGKVHKLALYCGADHAGAAALPDAGEKAAADFEKTVAVEGLEQNAITAGKKTVFLFSGLTDHNDRDMAECRVTLDFQTTLRPRHAGYFLSQIDKLRLLRVAESHGLRGTLCFEQGHRNVTEELFFYSQKEP